MINILEGFDIDSDIWVLHPQLKVVLREEYESKTDSKIIWGILLDIHPQSYFAELSPSLRRELIEKDYLQIDKFDWSKYSNAIDKLKKFVLTRPKRLLKNWEDKLEERDLFIYNTPYNEDNFDILEKAMKETYKMWDNYEKVLKAFTKEQEEGALGGVQESLSEKGIL